MPQYIPFNKPFIVGKELYYIAQTVLGGQTSGDGTFTKRCQQLLERTFSAHKVLLTTSCTSALEMAAMLCGVEAGDEVIMPSYTFVSTANAFLLRGATIKFVDIRFDTKNLDETLIEEAITERTKAIVPVHYAGVGCEMDVITDISNKYGIYLIEDAAQAVNAKYKGQYLGTLGDIGVYSFHETKNYICGEGGALVMNKDQLIERAEIIREKGTNRSQFFRGQVDKYTWQDIGSSYLPADILASFLYGQLEQMEAINEQRKFIFDHYYDKLKSLEERELIKLPVIPEYCEHNHHIFYILLNDNQTRTDLIKELKQQKIHAIFHYIPLHTSPMGKKLGFMPGQFPVTENISERLLRLPFFYELTEQEIERVTNAIFNFFSITDKSGNRP